MYDFYTTFEILREWTDVAEKMESIYELTAQIRKTMTEFGTHIVVLYLDLKIESKIKALKLVRYLPLLVCLKPACLFKSLYVN